MAGLIDEISSLLDGVTTYSHDDRGQLTGANHSTITDESYSYDDNGNRDMAGHDVDPNNRLMSDGTYNYEYDDEGNRTAKVTIVSGERVEYGWDHRNRLMTITSKTSGGTVTKTVNQSYDVFNQWVRSVVDSNGPSAGGVSERFFVYDDGQIVLEFDGSAANDLTHRYLWGTAIDQILADETVTGLGSAGTVTWPLTDHLGTARDLATYNAGTDTTSVANHRVYDSFGNLVSETSAAVDHLFGFTGRPYDEATGLQNNLHRWYNSESGTWMSEDPIGFQAGDGNLNRYVGNQASSYTDPFGLEKGHRVFDVVLSAAALRDLGVGEDVISHFGTGNFKSIETLQEFLGLLGAGNGNGFSSSRQTVYVDGCPYLEIDVFSDPATSTTWYALPRMTVRYKTITRQTAMPTANDGAPYESESKILVPDGRVQTGWTFYENLNDLIRDRQSANILQDTGILIAKWAGISSGIGVGGGGSSRPTNFPRLNNPSPRPLAIDAQTISKYIKDLKNPVDKKNAVIRLLESVKVQREMLGKRLEWQQAMTKEGDCVFLGPTRGQLSPINAKGEITRNVIVVHQNGKVHLMTLKGVMRTKAKPYMVDVNLQNGSAIEIPH